MSIQRDRGRPDLMEALVMSGSQHHVARGQRSVFVLHISQTRQAALRAPHAQA